MLPTTVLFRLFLILLLPFTLGAAIPQTNNHSHDRRLALNKPRISPEELVETEAWLAWQAKILRGKYAAYLDGRAKALLDKDREEAKKKHGGGTEDPKPQI
ncbi:hypothetical protein C343_04305 [Cryptococcus neoformans C23]|uniref:Uncharacterized protein n=1 Tax=Cryptococcus neoformans (strain H99 / ATCC 208821 / CBS 10515 / FGSC 9487) TaxID=235443 RepID=J9VU99_CRYN9|nr:hypothetical protein CNAG_05870 [Cryptococcus neoformans var. grubii H99]XP_012050592.1 hypothetical protein, variant [Cryptococcus neoformans var. grubii H99]AUB26080.1 hypothetical protein CKF44_05870 [Cryptococcus neoformans var. grubii]OWZ30605.1 hypothetical protein C347_04365 [Cryptococcus neoformans var. grubii AD2-60a]OWZ42378.1 hypothetical protein C343_04305 [Cryptococcus neoformans var. grubii C23]OXC83735.1 hypothetical protein C344_04058 [Cryptococcus neoformans var. grubii AD1|eukprot:XP_012050591.1 hypothetical protein CNAG_05870 [Cryptococcus neoformans var. grubii H99]